MCLEFDNRVILVYDASLMEAPLELGKISYPILEEGQKIRGTNRQAGFELERWNPEWRRD